MTDPLADYLDSVAGAALPARLHAIESDVLAAIEYAAHEDAGRRRVGMLSIGAALALGLVGGGLVGGAAQPAVASPLGIDALAPSTLLLGR